MIESWEMVINLLEFVISLRKNFELLIKLRFINNKIAAPIMLEIVININTVIDDFSKRFI